MKLIVGLGNPGEKYKNNRHNVGHMVADASKKIKIYKTNCFMNDSGSFVKKVLTDHGSLFTDHLYVIHDDLDISLGSYKIQFSKGPKEHKGLVSIYEALGTRDFWHVRVGIDARTKKQKGEDYVLEDFTKEEELVLEKTIKEICKKLETL